MSQQVNVTLTPVMNGTSVSTWQMNIQGAPTQPPPGTYPPLVVNEGNSADFKFTIQNAPQNVTFAAFLVPAKNSDIHHVSKPVNGSTVVTFEDHNLDKGPIPYEILFNEAPKIDPIIDNNGGGNFLSYFLVEYGAAGLALVVALIIGLFLQKRFRLLG
jgi:hypothetical protein